MNCVNSVFIPRDGSVYPSDLLTKKHYYLTKAEIWDIWFLTIERWSPRYYSLMRKNELLHTQSTRDRNVRKQGFVHLLDS